MTRSIALVVAATVALVATPALAKSKKHHRAHPDYYAQPYAAPYGGWTSRNVSDPSFGHRAGLNYARGTGRCVVDLGYGRYEYCGW
jgi:hypothetical protein